MKKLKTVFFIFLIANFFWSCGGIPKIQNGINVAKITDTKVIFENEDYLKMFSKKTGLPTTIVLVRHAEKMKNKKDPSLTPEGKQRAEKLNQLLSTLNIDYVFSTKYNRTLQTAEPTAKTKSLKIKNYDPRDLKGFGKSVKEEYLQKKLLVVGHSNTTPFLLNYFMGETVIESIDESDYSNLFIVNIFPDGTTKAILLKF